MMGKSSRSIKLALIGSALLLPGCGGGDEANPEVLADTEAGDGGLYYGPEGQEPTQNGQTSGSSVHRRSPMAGVAGAMIGSQVARSLSGGGGSSAPVAPSAAPSARGGFGASGGGLGASS